MSSYLKRTKVYFFVISVFMTCMLILCSYKFNITERFYKFRETNLNFRVPLLPITIKNTTLPDEFHQSQTISIRSISTDIDSDEFTTVSANVSINTIWPSKIDINYTKTGEADIKATIYPTLDTKSHTNHSLSNTRNKTTKDWIDRPGTSDQSIAPSGIPVGLKSSSLSELRDKVSDKNVTRPHILFVDNIDNNTSETDHTHIEVKDNNELTVDKGLGDTKLLNHLRNNKHRLPSSLRKPDNLKGYLTKLGLPNHIVSQITNEHIGQLSPSLAATFRPDICKNCFSNDFPAIIDEPELCEGEVYILILISSSVSKRTSRDAIRETWGSVCNKPESEIKCLFLFGKTAKEEENNDLVKESQIYHDLVQHDFRDTYANLTFKTMTAMKWATEKCPDAKYVMKTDDDMYLNTELLPILLQAAPSKRFMGGVCWGPSAPHRDLTSKWYVSIHQYSRSSFPPMCSGTGYVISGDVVPKILAQSKNIPFFYLEDVYIALCLKKVGIRPLLLQGFHHTFVDFDSCNYRNRVISSHGLNYNELLEIWEDAQQCPLDDTEPHMLYLPRPY